jgi:hypothetical protein
MLERARAQYVHRRHISYETHDHVGRAPSAITGPNTHPMRRTIGPSVSSHTSLGTPRSRRGGTSREASACCSGTPSEAGFRSPCSRGRDASSSPPDALDLVRVGVASDLVHICGECVVERRAREKLGDDDAEVVEPDREAEEAGERRHEVDLRYASNSLHDNDMIFGLAWM